MQKIDFILVYTRIKYNFKCENESLLQENKHYRVKMFIINQTKCTNFLKK